MTWKLFKRYFKQNYLTEMYYDEKPKEFNDLRLGQMAMDGFVNKFTSLQTFISYLNEEKEKVQHFINCLPQVYRDILEFVNTKTMDETIRKKIMLMGIQTKC